MGFLASLLGKLALQDIIASALLSLAKSLAAPETVKKMVILGLEKAVVLSDNKVDDQFLEIAKKQWEADEKK